MPSFVKIKPSRNGKITLSFIDIGKPCLSREFFTSLICLFMLFAKMKFSRKFPNLQYMYHTLTRIYEHFENVMLKHLSMTYSVHVSLCGAHYSLASGHALESFPPANGIVPLYRPVSKTPFTCKWHATIGPSAKRCLHANGMPLSARQQNAVYMQMACHYRPARKTPFTCK